ncbi:Uncharacterised protein [uncultured archaeon]|nr:Uncharacterised protein [uncultured archaeon]
MSKESAHSKHGHAGNEHPRGEHGQAAHDNAHSHQEHEHAGREHMHGEHAHAHGGQAGAEHDEFLASIRKLKEAEKSAEAILEAAKRQASATEALSRERAVEISAKAAEKAVLAKNEILAEGRKKTETEVSSIINDAKKQAEKIRGRRLDGREVAALSQSVL